MSDTQYWHYLDGAGQQQGPITADELQQFGVSGHINGQTSVWTEGMAEWLPAAQIDGLIPAQAAAPSHQPQINLGGAAPAQRVNPYSSPATAVSPAAAAPQAGGDYPIPLVSKVNFGLYIGTMLAGFALYIISVLRMNASPPTAESGGLGLPLILLLLGFILLLVSGIIQLMAIYRAWAILAPGGGTVSPGKAIGFLFIPFFGPIWMIIILCKLPGEWNSIVSRFQNTASSPRLSVGMVICMLLIPIIGQILWMKELAAAINFMVSARLMPSNQAQPQTGGIRLH